ncbi:MAG TPA: acyl carrier protein [bacterium]|nr:acyl carrier protein [bacterium]
MSTEEKVKEIVVKVLDVDPAKVTPTASFAVDLGADSLDQADLVMELEEAFGVEIPDEDAGKIKSVQQAIDYVNSKK